MSFRTLLLNFPKSKLKTQAIYSLALGLFQQQNYQGCQKALEKYMPDLKDEDLEVDPEQVCQEVAGHLEALVEVVVLVVQRQVTLCDADETLEHLGQVDPEFSPLF